jgi:hypothetical protein
MMKFPFDPELILGSLLIVWGISIFIKAIWGIDIPVFKPLLAIFLIYLGFSLLFGPHFKWIVKRETYSYRSKSDDRD